MVSESKKICVFAASSPQVARPYVDDAYRLGGLLAQHGWQCVDGAGAQGLMRAVADGVLDGGGHVTGVIPKFMVDNGWCYDRLPELVITADMHERKQLMSAMADAIVALPGGCGTLEELLEAITWRQLGLSAKPIVLLNTQGFFDSLIAMLRHAIEQGFMKSSHHDLWTVASTPQGVVDALETQLSHTLPPVEPKL